MLHLTSASWNAPQHLTSRRRALGFPALHESTPSPMVGIGTTALLDGSQVDLGRAGPEPQQLEDPACLL